MPGARSIVPVLRFLDTALPVKRWAQARWERTPTCRSRCIAASATLDHPDRTQGGAALQMTRVERWAEDALLST